MDHVAGTIPVSDVLECRAPGTWRSAGAAWWQGRVCWHSPRTISRGWPRFCKYRLESLCAVRGGSRAVSQLRNHINTSEQNPAVGSCCAKQGSAQGMAPAQHWGGHSAWGRGAFSFKQEVVLVPFRAPKLLSVTIPGKENISSLSGAGGGWHSWLVHGKAAQTSLLAEKSIFSLQFVPTLLLVLTHRHIYTATPVLATCVQASHTNAQCDPMHSCYSTFPKAVIHPSASITAHALALLQPCLHSACVPSLHTPPAACWLWGGTHTGSMAQLTACYLSQLQGRGFYSVLLCCCAGLSDQIDFKNTEPSTAPTETASSPISTHLC